MKSYDEYTCTVPDSQCNITKSPFYFGQNLSLNTTSLFIFWLMSYFQK